MSRHHNPVHVRHDPDGRGPVCAELTCITLRDYTANLQRHLDGEFDVHPAHGCPHTDRKGAP